jgi:hypothetical protein
LTNKLKLGDILGSLGDAISETKHRETLCAKVKCQDLIHLKRFKHSSFVKHRETVIQLQLQRFAFQRR